MRHSTSKLTFTQGVAVYFEKLGGRAQAYMLLVVSLSQILAWLSRT